MGYEEQHLDHEIDEELLMYMHGCIDTAVLVSEHAESVHRQVIQKAESEGKVLTLDGSNEEDEALYKKYYKEVLFFIQLPLCVFRSSTRPCSLKNPKIRSRMKTRGRYLEIMVWKDWMIVYELQVAALLHRVRSQQKQRDSSSERVFPTLEFSTKLHCFEFLHVPTTTSSIPYAFNSTSGGNPLVSEPKINQSPFS